MKKYSLDSKEKEAILTAIGTLDCGSLIDNRLKVIIKNQKNKRDKNAL